MGVGHRDGFDRWRKGGEGGLGDVWRRKRETYDMEMNLVWHW